MRLALLVVVAVSARARAGAAILIPPLEADIGETAPIGSTITGVATDMLVGVHWGSLAWKPTRFELGVGFIRSSRAISEPLTLGRIADASTAPQTSLDLDGGYLTLGRTIFDRHHVRTWVLARAELLHGDFDGRAFCALGAAARIASELYASGSATGGGVLAGTFAIGVYVEASHRELASELGPDGVTSGISIRLPFIFAGS